MFKPGDLLTYLWLLLEEKNKHLRRGTRICMLGAVVGTIR